MAKDKGNKEVKKEAAMSKKEKKAAKVAKQNAKRRGSD